MPARFFALCLLLGCLDLTNAVPIDDVNAAAFVSYLTEYNKTYTALEQPKAFGAFKVSLKQIAELNELEGAEVYGLTKFSDVPADEFRARFLTYKPSNETQDIPILDASGDEISAAPKTMDWRTKGKVTPVKAGN